MELNQWWKTIVILIRHFRISAQTSARRAFWGIKEVK
jgi:hypothetical protein